MNKNDILGKHILLTLNTINLFYLSHTHFCLPVTILLLVLYCLYSKDNYVKKKNLILVYSLFSLLTITGESIFIKTTNLLKYINPDIFNVSSWLFSAYLNMVLLIYILKDSVV